MKEISFIVPVYNVEPYLERCVNSILKADVDSEIILVDDMSTDNSVSLAKKMLDRDSRIKLIINSKKQLAGGSRNVGIATSKAEFLAFVDSDDFIHPDIVPELIKKLKQESADVLVCGVDRVDELTLNHRPWTRYPRIKTIHQDEIFLNTIGSVSQIQQTVWDKIYLKSFIDKSGITFNYDVYWEDTGTIPKWMYYAQRLVYHPGVYYYYVPRAQGSYSTVIKEKHLTSWKFVLEDLLHFIKKYNPKYESVYKFGLYFNKLIEIHDSIVKVNNSEMLEIFVELFGKDFIDISLQRMDELKSALFKKDVFILRPFFWFLDFLRSIKRKMFKSD